MLGLKWNCLTRRFQFTKDLTLSLALAILQCRYARQLNNSYTSSNNCCLRVKLEPEI